MELKEISTLYIPDLSEQFTKAHWLFIFSVTKRNKLHAASYSRHKDEAKNTSAIFTGAVLFSKLFTSLIKRLWAQQYGNIFAVLINLAKLNAYQRAES